MSPLKLSIFNFSQKANPFVNLLFEDLQIRGWKLYLFSTNSLLFNIFKEKKWFVKKIKLPFLANENKINFLFIAFLPVYYIAFFILLVYIKFKKEINIAVCLQIKEKIIISPLAQILNIKLIWLEDCSRDYNNLNKPLLLLYKVFSKKATILGYGPNFKKSLLKLGVNEKNIKIIRPGLRLNEADYQDNIFSKIATVGREKQRKNFFTIGVVANLDKEQKIEPLFQAIKVCLSVIPSVQLVIVGDGEERKNLAWLAKKMEIDSLVWFVGEQKFLKKWLLSFDLLVVAKTWAAPEDLETALRAMLTALPVIGPSNSALEEIIKENKTGCLIEIDNSEMLARQIIKLYKDKNLRFTIGEMARQDARENFSLPLMVSDFERAINN